MWGAKKSNTDGMAEMEVGALSERALRCPGEHPSDEYECGEKLMSTGLERTSERGRRLSTRASSVVLLLSVVL